LTGFKIREALNVRIKAFLDLLMVNGLGAVHEFLSNIKAETMQTAEKNVVASLS
jgi:hypothetical protein